MSLYKYITPERLDVVKSLFIRFTQAIALNDPFDLRPFASGFRRPEIVAKDLAEEFDQQLPWEIAKYESILNPSEKAILPVLVGLQPAAVGKAIELIDAAFPTLKEALFQKL